MMRFVCVCVCACVRVGCCVGIKEEGEEPRTDSPLFKLLTERAPDLDAKAYLSWLKRFLPSGTHIGHHHHDHHDHRTPIHPSPFSEEELNAPPPTEELVRTSVAEFLKVRTSPSEQACSSLAGIPTLCRVCRVSCVV